MKPLLSNLVDSADDVQFKKQLPISSPVNGKIRPLHQYPSSLYTERMFGEGVCVELSGYQVVAPFNCLIEQLYPTAEQLRIRSAQGIRMQIQLGLNPESMMGNGFKLHVKPGDKIAKGEPLLEFDLRKMKTYLTSELAAITILNSDKLKALQPNYRQVIANEDIIFNLFI